MVFLLSGINRENVQGGPRLAMEPHGLTFPGDPRNYDDGSKRRNYFGGR